MDLLKLFVEHLSSQKNNASKATIKNYRADVRKFIRWFETQFHKPLNPKDITPQLIEVYSSQSKTSNFKDKKLSPRSFERHLSSLRKFFRFLKIEGIISKNPFETISNSLKNASLNKDKWHLNQFKNYLYVYNSAYLTIKNYIIDIKQFFSWLEQVTGINNAWDVRKRNVFEKVNPMLINEYKERLLATRTLGGVGLSPKTINRKLSSLRKYLAWAQEEKLIKPEWQDLQIKNQRLETRAPLPLTSTPQPSVPSQENHRKYSRLPPLRLLQKTTNGLIFILDSLFILPLAKAIEQAKYLFWKIKGKQVFKQISSNASLKMQRAKHLIRNYSKAMYDPLSISTLHFPLHKKVWHHVRHTRPKWYKRYHSYAVVHYFHFAILVILMSAIGFALYNEFITSTQDKREANAFQDSQPRIFTFKGRLTDSLDNPIISANTVLRISLYNDQTANGPALLWQEVVSVNPNKDGVFKTELGRNIPIPQSLFFQNASLWLGISIGEEAELTPRQQLATVSFAANAQTLQGLLPISNADAGSRNVILALDSSGNLNIGGSATPVFQASGGQFTLSGKVLLLTTAFGSNSDVIISPDGFGKIDLNKPLQNTSNNNNIPTAIGAVEVDDLLAVLATSSAQSALTINQDSTGPIISASSSGTAKFTVENSGNIISAKGANWQPYIDSANGLNIASSSGIPFVTFDTLHASVGIGTVIPQTSLDVIGTFRASGDITLSKFVADGGILYTNASGVLAQITSGTSTQCLLGGTIPKFGTCPPSAKNENFVSEGNGAIFPYSATLDLLVGGQSTSSAKFAFINVNSGTPTASISGNIVLDAAGNIQTTKLQTLTIGGLTTGGIALSPGSTSPSLFASTGGSIGIGTTVPLFKLDIQDSKSGSAAAQIFNTNNSTDADGLIVKLGNTNTTTVAKSNHFINFETSGIGIVGSIQGTGEKNIAYVTNGIADLAEYLKKDEKTNIEYGDVVCIDNKGLVVACDKNNTRLVGVASEHPTFLGGENLGNRSIAVGLVGQLPVKVSALNGPVNPGDPLTSSNIPGVAVKATSAGQIIGKASESCGLTKFSNEATPRTGNTVTDDKVLVKYQKGVDSEGIEPSRPTFLRSAPKPSEPTPSILCGKILTLVNISWYDPNVYLSTTGVLEIIRPQNTIIKSKSLGPFTLKNPFGETIEKIGVFTNAIVANLQVGFVKAEEITTNSISIATESVTITGINIKDYVSQIVEQALFNKFSNFNTNKIISPIAEINEIHTNIISPLASESIVIKLAAPSSLLSNPSLIIKNSSGSAVATIDTFGHASFSGTLNSKQLLVSQDATIEGTLKAKRILAESIEGLDAKVSTLAAQYVKSPAAAKVSPPLPNDAFTNIASSSSYLASFNNLSAFTATFTQGLMSFGPTSLAETSIAGWLSIQGSLILAYNSINVLGNDLQLQPLRQGGISFLAGLVKVDQNGNLKVQGNAEFAKDVAIKGDLVASGSGTFSKINLSLVQPAQALSQTEIIATGAAGVATIKAHQIEVTIINKLITDSSLIYITPVGSPSAQSPFLMRQTLGESFTVGVQRPNQQDTLFNWLIVN